MNVAMASTIVPELLERGNYERWSIFMKNYLVSQDLWMVTQRLERPSEVSKLEWRKRNAAAKHAIQISCGIENFNEIKEIYWAVEAWYKLKRINTEEENPEIDSEHEEEKEETPKITSASMIVPVPELLASDNYKRWSICMKSYLVSQDLWDVILYSWAPTKVDTKEWIKKDAAALHAIQISCRPKKFDEIKEITSARTAWNALQQKHIEKHPEDGPSDIHDVWEEQGFQTMERSQSLIVHNAIDKGNVDAVVEFFNRNPGATNLGHWTGYPTLHYATMVGNLNIVRALVESMPVELDINQKNEWGDTVLTTAAGFGKTEIAKCLVNKNSTLLSTVDKDQEIPVVTACRQGHKELTDFLYSETPFEILLSQNGEQGFKLLLGCFNSKRFDIMFDVLHRSPSLIDECWKDLLDGFASTPAAFMTGSGLTFWQRWTYDCFKVAIPSNFAVVTIKQEKENIEEIPLPGRLWRLASILLPFLGIKQIHALKLSHGFARASLHFICQHLTNLHWTKFEDTIALSKALTKAIENDIYDFLIEVAETNADILIAPLPKDDKIISGNYLMDAITFRQEKIVRFIIGLPLGKSFIKLLDPQKNNVLHIAGKLAFDSQLSRISGAALQMQREIQWFKAVESIVRQYQKDAKNENGETAYQVFDREHKGLLKEARDWVKGLASSYIIVGALVITIMFVAAFTHPGGNNQNTGFPIFKNKRVFMIYIINDAISLFAAAASVIIFLGFLTSRYNMEDFHISIPMKLMAGLSTLFISLAAMMIAFFSAIFLMLENQWLIIMPSVLLASIPASLFVWLQFPLLLEIFILTFRSPIFSEESFGKQNKSILLGEKED